MLTITKASVLLSAAAAFSSVPAHAAPPIAYSIANGSAQDLYLVNPDGSGRVLVYSTPSRVDIGILDVNPAANQLAIAETRSTGFKIIDYSPAGTRLSVTPVNDGCLVEGLDFHPTDGSLLVSEYCEAQDVQQVRRWRAGSFGLAPLVTFGSGHDNALGRVRWLGDGSGFLILYAHSTGATIDFRIQRHMLGALGSPVTVVDFPSANNSDFDTARCAPHAVGCWAMVYDDGSGEIHKVHFDGTGTTEDSVQAGATPHFSPNNAQLLYRLQRSSGYQLKIDSFPLASNGKVGPGIDWRP